MYITYESIVTDLNKYPLSQNKQPLLVKTNSYINNFVIVISYNFNK